MKDLLCYDAKGASDMKYIFFRAHQNHYEQFGDIRGTVTIDNVDYPLDLNVMRDHTHGSVRDWRLMHRYGIHNFRTQTGFR